jgi:hypothetical protein
LVQSDARLQQPVYGSDTTIKRFDRNEVTMNKKIFAGAIALSFIVITPLAAEEESSWVPPGMTTAVKSTGGFDGGRHGGSVVATIKNLFSEGVRGADFGAAVSGVARSRGEEASQGRAGGFGRGSEAASSAGGFGGGNAGGNGNSGGNGNGNGGGRGS